MNQYRILALTDYRGHSNQNSIYPLLRGIQAHERCVSVYVASRGFEKNKSFFLREESALLFASKVDPSFGYTEEGDHYKENLDVIDPETIDIVLMRLPRPVSDEFLIWVKETFSESLMINDPIGILETSSKAYLLNFPELCPSMQLCRSVDQVIAIANDHPIVLKPLKEYGGKGLLKIEGTKTDDGQGIHDTQSYLENISVVLDQEGYLAMKYLKNVTEGDKRLLVVDGQIMTSVLRMPAEGSWLCNIAQGGRPEPSEPTESEYAIIDEISPYMRKAGVFMYGVDTLMDDDGQRILSEINTLSIGGFISGESENGNQLVDDTLEKLFNYADARR